MTWTLYISKKTTSQVGRFRVTPVITLMPVEKMLGLYISQDLTFKQHLLTHKDSIQDKLNKRVETLKQLRKVASFKTRLCVANSIFMSALGYCMPVWAGAPDYLIASLQTIQIEAAGVVTGRNWVPGAGPRRVPTAELLQQCGWLSLQQLGVDTSVAEVHKEPRYL